MVKLSFLKAITSVCNSYIYLGVTVSLNGWCLISGALFIVTASTSKTANPTMPKDLLLNINYVAWRC